MVIKAGLYNQRSSEIDRQNLVSEILRKQKDFQEEEDDEVANDEQINELLARNPVDFKK